MALMFCSLHQVSTSHCVYATCRDATESFNVIVPREA
eukprot:SAG11_NODE_4903_length_1728_cov_2.362799_1_plen_36_part_10